MSTIKKVPNYYHNTDINNLSIAINELIDKVEELEKRLDKSSEKKKSSKQAR